MDATGRRRLLWAAGALALAGAGLALAYLPGQARDTDRQDSGADPGYAALQAQVRRYPQDARAWVLKARADMQAGRHLPASQAYAQALEVGRKVAQDPSVWVEYAEALALTQGGTLAGEPMRLLERALALKPTHPGALDLAGSAAWEVGDYRNAARYWQRLQQNLAADDPRQQALAAALETAERRARMSLP